MRIIALILLCLFVGGASAQNSDIKLDKSNNNKIQVIQAGTVITYDLLNEQQKQKFLKFLRSFPAIQEQLSELEQNILIHMNQLEQRITNKLDNKDKKDDRWKKNQDTLLINIARNTSKDGFISPSELEQSVKKYIEENNQLKAEIAELKVQNKDTEFASVLVQAEEKLKQFDNEGYQQVLEAFKQERKAKLQNMQQQYAQTAYLQAQNSYNQFRYEKALQQVEEALHYSASNSNYLLLKGDICNSSYRLEEAIETYLILSKANKNDTLQGTVFNHLGMAYDSKGAYDQAIEYYNKSLSIRLKVLGPKHPDVATSYNSIGTAYAGKGAYDQAINYYTESLSIRLKVLGFEHPDVATLYNNLGGAYLGKGSYKYAIEYYNKSLSIRLNVLNPLHPNVATTYNNLGVAYGAKGLYDQAIEYFDKGLLIRLKVLGPEHPDVATSYNNLGGAYNSKELYDQAIMYCDKGLLIRLKLLGPEHPDVATSYNNLGGAYKNKGLYDQAIKYYNKGLLIQLKLLGPEHPDVATSYNNLGGAYNSKELYDQAIKYYSKSLSIRLKVLGFEHPRTQASLLNCGLNYIMAQQLLKGLSYIEKAKEYKNLPVNEKINYFNNRGAEFFKKQKYQLSLNLYLVALHVLKQSQLKQADALWAVVSKNIAIAHCYMGNKKEATKYFERAIILSKVVSDKKLNKSINQNYQDCKR